MTDNPMEFFNLNPNEIKNRLDEFTILELSENHQGAALAALLMEQDVNIPEWCQYFLLRGLVSVRRDMLDTYHHKYGSATTMPQ